MKNSLMSLIVGVCTLATVANADINVAWQGTDGFLKNDDQTGILEPISGLTAYAQLIYSPVAVYSSTFAAGGQVDPTYQILDTYVITDSGGADAYGSLPIQFYSGVFQAGFIYARVFDGGTGNPANIVAGTWYYNGPIVATVNNVVPDSPDNYNANGANTSVTFGAGDVLNHQVTAVPEPTTLAFLGIGGLVLAARRRKA